MSLTAASPSEMQAWAPFMSADPKTMLTLSPIHPRAEQDFEISCLGNEGSKSLIGLGAWPPWRRRRLDGWTSTPTVSKVPTAGTPERLRGIVSLINEFVTSLITTERLQPKRDTNPGHNLISCPHNVVHTGRGAAHKIAAKNLLTSKAMRLAAPTRDPCYHRAQSFGGTSHFLNVECKFRPVLLRHSFEVAPLIVVECRQPRAGYKSGTFSYGRRAKNRARLETMLETLKNRPTQGGIQILGASLCEPDHLHHSEVRR